MIHLVAPLCSIYQIASPVGRSIGYKWALKRRGREHASQTTLKLLRCIAGPGPVLALVLPLRIEDISDRELAQPMRRRRLQRPDVGEGVRAETQCRDVEGAKARAVVRERGESLEVCVRFGAGEAVVQMERLELQPGLRDCWEIVREVWHDGRAEVCREAAEGAERQERANELRERFTSSPPAKHTIDLCTGAGGPSEGGEQGPLRDQGAEVVGQRNDSPAGFGEGEGAESQSIKVNDEGTDGVELVAGDVYALESTELDRAP